MEIRVEESNGIKKYFVNGKQYDRLDDIPEEFKPYFVDKNNNGIPDQFDSLFDLTKKESFSFKTFKSLLQSSMVPENENQPINKLEKNPFLSTPLKIFSAMAVLLLIALSYYFYQHYKKPSTKGNGQVSELIVQPKSMTNSFEGTYLSGNKENGHFWVELIITPLAQQSKFQIEIKSKELKGYSCCELAKEGIYESDTIFVKTTDWKRPVTMIITKTKSASIIIGAIEKQEDDRFALSYYCCGGKSLIGEYVKSPRSSN